jgi:hypothetical protein
MKLDRRKNLVAVKTAKKNANATDAVEISCKDFLENCDMKADTDKCLDAIYSREQHIKDLNECMQKGIADYDRDFYIVYLNYPDPLFPNRIIFSYLARKSCPTPHYHQNVYHIDKERKIHLMWSIPHAQMKESSLDPIQKKYLNDFRSGALLQECKRRELKTSTEFETLTINSYV